MKYQNMNLDLNMKTNVRSKTPRYNLAFQMKISQNDETWQLKASCKKCKQWQENKISAHGNVAWRGYKKPFPVVTRWSFVPRAPTPQCC